MTARCKFYVGDKVFRENSQGEKSQINVKLYPVFDQSTEENRRFTKATPSGNLELTIDNPALFDFFTPGKYYYVDIQEASE